MTNSDLSSIENALKVKLPAEYRGVMSDRQSQNGEFWYGGMFNNAQVIIDRTLEFRELTASYGAPCSLTCVVVSEVNGGDSVLLETSKPESGLWLWNHETMTAHPSMDTVLNFVESTLRLIKANE